MLRRLLFDCTAFVLLAATASCVALSAPAPLPRRCLGPARVVASLPLDYGAQVWDVTLYQGGVYRATRPGEPEWAGVWRTSAEVPSVIEVEEGVVHLEVVALRTTRWHAKFVLGRLVLVR